MPDKAALPLKWLSISLQNIQHQDRAQQPVSSAGRQQLSQILKEKIQACKLELKQTERKMQQVQRQHHQCNNLATLVKLLHQQKDQAISEGHRRWLQERENQASQQAAACNPEAQWLITLQLKMLALQLSFYQDQLFILHKNIHKA